MDTNQQLFVLIGEAVTSWSQIERTLANIYCIACDAAAGPQRIVSERVFWSIGTFEGKKKLVDTALDAWLLKDDPATQKIWNDLKSAIAPVQQRRNDLAHASIIDVSIGGPAETVIAPKLYQSLNRQQPLTSEGKLQIPFAMLRVEDLQKTAKDIDELSLTCSVAHDRLFAAYLTRKGKPILIGLQSQLPKD